MTERSVTVLVTYQGETLGQAGPFPVTHPRWQQTGQVAEAAERLLGVPVLVLRLLAHGGTGGVGGDVAYHVEALARPTAGLEPTVLEVGEDPLRALWATPDGLRAALAWAAERAGASGPALQVKSWNLSGLYRLPVGEGSAWLKTTPPFAVDEALVIRHLASVTPESVPVVLAAEPGRLLLADAPGVDCWGLPEDGMLAAVPRLVAAQAALAGKVDDLPDRTPRALVAAFAALLPRLTGLTPEERAAAEQLLSELPFIVDELSACGLPETLVHGDFHPGNWRFDGERTTLIDFSDSYLGHPAVDGLRPRDFLSEERWKTVRRLWTEAWTTHAPGSDPARALELAEPLVHLGYAVRYQEFLDGIEATERVYHAGDPESEVRAAIAR
ncbi:aminoglycoside phosphotransferase family protein [Kitasatospora albolonga]|uniref:aminoglycoside phosphotransferase family protein n=1 Tax=Kitasatospora albolonga TaxID=68173 RepID=UPI0031EC5CDF